MMRLSAFLFLVFCQLALFSAPLQINGTADQAYRGKPVYLYEVADALSEYQVLLAHSVVREDGSFILQSEVSSATVLVISIDRVTARMYAAPGKSYDLFFPARPATQPKTLNSTNNVQLVFNQVDSTDLNYRISSFNLAFDEFVERNVADIFDKAFLSVFETFRKEQDSNAQAFGDPFYRQFVHFSFADLGISMGLGRKQLYQKFLKDQPIDIKNPAFGRFLAVFFQDELQRFDGRDQSRPLESAIQKRSASLFRDSLSRHEFLGNNPVLADITGLLILSQTYAQVPAYRTDILDMISQVGATATDPQVGQLARDYYAVFTAFEPGSPAYNFNLLDSEGKNVSLRSFAGKPVLISFWASWSKESLSELNLLRDLQLKFQKDVRFVNISVDDDIVAYRRFLADNPQLRGIFLNYGADKLLMEKYAVMRIPQFVLIDGSGNYIRFRAPEPSRGLEKILRNFPAR